MIKTFNVGGSVCGYPEKVILAEEVNGYVYTLQCEGWEILDINQTGGILPWDIDKEYVEYKIACSRPDPDIDYNTSKEENKMEFCEETVSLMMSNFVNKFTKKTLGIEDIDAEIDDVKGSISNERIWQKGSDTEEEILMFEQNIVDHTEYINRLESLKDKFQNVLKELEKSLGSNEKIILDTLGDFAKSPKEA